jgi:hypothetical protein
MFFIIVVGILNSLFVKASEVGLLHPLSTDVFLIVVDFHYMGSIHQTVGGRGAGYHGDSGCLRSCLRTPN